MHGGNRLAGKALGRDLHDLDLRMAGKESQHFAPGIPRASDDGCPDHPALSARSSTDVARSSSAIEMCSRGVWSRCELPGPYATA